MTGRAGLVDGAPPRLIGAPLAQVVQVPVGNHRQAFIARVVVQMIGPLTQFAGGRAREGAVQRIEFREHPNICFGIAPGERLGGRSPAIADVAAVAVLTDQPGDLRTGPAADLLTEVLDDPSVGLAQGAVTQLPQGLAEPLIDFFAGRGFKIKGGGAVQK